MEQRELTTEEILFITLDRVSDISRREIIATIEKHGYIVDENNKQVILVGKNERV